MNTERPVWKTFLLFLGPMMLANILQALSGTLNNIFLGKMIGVSALAAASSFFPLLLFIISFVMGLGSGASVLIGQAWGAKQPERVREVAGTALSLGLLLGLGVAFNIDVIVPALERLLNASFLPRDIYLISRMPSEPQYADIMPIVVISLVLAFLATLYPSWRASRVNPAEALRYE